MDSATELQKATALLWVIVHDVGKRIGEKVPVATVERFFINPKSSVPDTFGKSFYSEHRECLIFCV